ncbi:paramyosin [Trichonephila inaurata madagascariensis]|uniref:Paramyosin n=1 Tax=Trichonephila inaurata madagascariensis TaxID=2747483 RepID=A0A8X6WKW0_9ARAC|nr:paramyosin [Trichonephila inaurata madagascariensis]
MSTTVKTTKYTYKSSTGGASSDVTMEYGTDIGAFTRLEDKIRLLQEDLEFERELRQKIEREKSELTVHLLQITERLEEAEGSSESHVEMNKKRDTELSKLRKLLEDVHLERETPITSGRSTRRPSQKSRTNLTSPTRTGQVRSFA